MDEADRQLLRRCRVRLVGELQVAELWDALLSRELFTRDMIEDIQRTGSGSRRDQARQLVTDLETRGRQALPLFISCLEDTGQDTLASFLRTSRQAAKQDPEAVKPLDHLVPVVLGPIGLKPKRVVNLDPSQPVPGNLTPVVLGPEELWPARLRPEILRPETPRPMDNGSGRVHDACAPENIKGHADMAYILNADPCGHCLIINNVNFCPSSGLSTRTGSNVDCEKLQYRFRWLHFMVEVKNDLTAKQMVAALVEMAKRDHHALDCFVVVILSHGCQGLGASKMAQQIKVLVAKPGNLEPAWYKERAGSCKFFSDPNMCVVTHMNTHHNTTNASHLQFPGAVYGTDGCSVPIEKIVNIFNGTGCPSLGGKPKLFFIQACGGEQKDHGFEVTCASSQGRAFDSDSEPDAVPCQEGPRAFDQLDAVSSLPTPSDILVSYSTFPGFVSWRDKKSGSWYIETLDGILEQWAASEDLQSLLLRVSNAVSEKGIYKQIPGCFNFLRKKLFFKT